MPSFRAGGALGGPCWPSSAQLPNEVFSEDFAPGLPHLPDTAGQHETFCLACRPSFRVGGGAGRARAARNELYREEANLGALAP
eukprot:1140915-Pelagomonas_calceolata.AAC.2